MKFLEHKLGNGLEIVAECNPDAHSTALGFFVNTGARDETDEVAGVSHFLEHMMFKGTPTRTAEDVNREFDELGAHYNAYTSEENTVYYAAVLPEYLDPAVALLADMLRPSLRKEDFDTEKQVIIEEIRMYQDQPPYGADDRLKVLFFGDHPLARSVLGTVDTIDALRVEQMHDYFRQRYSPGNITVVGAGKIDFDQLVRQVQNCCGQWQPVETSRDVPAAVPHPGFECVRQESSAQEYTMQLAAGPSGTDHDRFPAKILATVLGDDSGSRLFWELIDPGLAESASLGHHDYHGAGAFMTFLSCDPELAQDNLARIRDLYQKVEEHGITQAELNQAKNKINSRVVLGSEKPRGRLFNIGGNWLQRREYRSVKTDLDAVEAVTLEQVAAVLKKYPLTRSTTICVGPVSGLKAP
ncbi:MAG: M16 family metallopeptidase [Pirellulales bacterium]